jgi:acyl carrier protein
VDEGDITPAATLRRDLGADSLDLLEITFRLEQEFGIEIPRGELWTELMFRARPEWVQDGKLTDKGLAELRAGLPYADFRGFQLNQGPCAFSDLVTVDLVGAYVESKLGCGAGPNIEPCHG